MEASVFAEGLGYPEGPLALPDGRILVTDVRGGAVLAVDREGRVSLYADTGGGPDGLALGPDGVVYCANNGGLQWVDGRAIGPSEDYTGGTLQAITPNGGVTTVRGSSENGPFVHPNDIALDRSGGIWFTDSGRGPSNNPDSFVYYVDADLTDVVVAAGGYRFTNGLAFVADESELIVAETKTGHIWVHPVAGPGKLGERRLFCTLPEHHRPDGICIDVDGNVIVAGVLGAGVIVYDRFGTYLDRIAFEHRLVTNVAFGGADHSTLYVTESGFGRMCAVPWPRPGIVLPFYAD